MLCQFSVKNFRSIKDTIVLDMQTASIIEHVDTVLKCQDGETFLPVAVLYGPNGGKSNVLHAIHALWTVVLKPSHLIQGDRQEEYNMNHVVPFKFLNETQNQPTKFEMFFRTDSAEYRYILHIQNKKVFLKV